jgi:hypothetical protein
MGVAAEHEGIVVWLLNERRREAAFVVGQTCVLASAIVSATLYALFLVFEFSGRETLEKVAGSIAWKLGTQILGWSAVIGFVLVLFGRGYKRVVLGLVALFLSWLFVFPYGIEVR